MVKKLTPALVDKYDIAQKMLKQLANLESRTVLFSIIKKQETVSEISKKTEIPLSTVYVIISKLFDSALIVKKYNLNDDGRRTVWYQSKVKEVCINITKFEPEISFKKNTLMKHGKTSQT
ncbi:DUF742 domain-containing protein [Nitrosopumilus sp.]|uniref:DUF742 domain-containing protein n=1 Tax=Nitrosopumilus sp. TaxID=2024843 RepID=UPI00262CB019|nr:DUF742 domain-containing protein [Nitrosopumilus sp.]